MNILMTGASGYIGANYLEEANNIDREIFPVDLIPGKNMIKADVCKPLDIDVGQPLGVIHLAGISRSGSGEEDPRKTFEVNVQGTVNVLDFAIQHEARWVILAGTHEDSGGAYSTSKRLMKDVAKYYASRGLKIGVLNLSYIYSGIGEPTDRLIPRFVSKAIRNELISIDAPHLQFDFISVQDVVAGFCLFEDYIERTNVNYTECDLCTGIGTKITDLAKLIIKTIGSSSRLVIDTRKAAYVSLPDPTFFNTHVNDFKKKRLEEEIIYFCENANGSVKQ